jgi:hypothetical protein
MVVTPVWLGAFVAFCDFVASWNCIPQVTATTGKRESTEKFNISSAYYENRRKINTQISFVNDISVVHQMKKSVF